MGWRGLLLMLGWLIHENTPIRQIEPGRNGASSKLHHDHGVVTALRLVLAGNAYLDKRAPKLMQQRLAPVTSAIIATEPLGENVIRDLLPGRIAVADCNTALNYYRFDGRGRMLFGGRASYTAQDFGIRRDLLKRMKSVSPGWPMHRSNATGQAVSALPSTVFRILAKSVRTAGSFRVFQAMVLR